MRRALQDGVRRGVFPGAVAAVGRPRGRARELALAWAGATGDGRRVGPRTVYDLASLTKPFVAMAALRLAERGVLSLDDRAEKWVAEIAGTPGGAATLRALLAHRGGMAAWGALHREVPEGLGADERRRWMIGEAARRGSGDARGTETYSDLGYFVASEAVARAAGASLRRVVEREVVTRLRHDPATHELAARHELDLRWARRPGAAPTELCAWRGRVVRGDVHDENCAAFGGDAGNAGLFGDARSTLAFAELVLAALEGRSRWLAPGTLRDALAPIPGGTHVVGWDTKSAASSSAGTLMGPGTFGHLGFTGTSLWIDPDARVTVVLLSNRVHPTRANELIRAFRPRFHDAVMAAASRTR
ncbi:MAG: beta-lactamase family protein [Deltaproteobacteria bacterium]|nr:beta-lactamase family protein [Deltaproteobacteria bacterium]